MPSLVHGRVQFRAGRWQNCGRPPNPIPNPISNPKSYPNPDPKFLTLLLTLSITLNLTLTLFLTLNLTLNVTVIGLGGLPRFCPGRFRYQDQFGTSAISVSIVDCNADLNDF